MLNLVFLSIYLGPCIFGFLVPPHSSTSPPLPNTHLQAVTCFGGLTDQLMRVCPEAHTVISALDTDFLVFPVGALSGWSSRWKCQSFPVCAVDFQNLK